MASGLGLASVRQENGPPWQGAADSAAGVETGAGMAEFLRRPLFDGDRLIHVLDPEPAACQALSVAFRLEGFQTGFSIDVKDFGAAMARRRPDLAVINFHIGTADGLAVMRRTRAMHPGLPVIMVQDVPQVEQAVAAVKAGAADVVARPLDAARLMLLAREALQGASLRHPVVRDRVEYNGAVDLTRRERQVLQLVAGGRSNKEAGHQLGISPRTIEAHRARVMEKLGARNTADLLRIVLTA